MSVTRKEFTDLLGESISADLAADTAFSNQQGPAFSEAFEKRMTEFFSGKNDMSGKAKIKPKRWLIVAIAAVLLLAAVACAVPEIRRSIAGFFVKMFGDHVEYTDPDITKDRIEEEYGLVPIPDGFEETEITRMSDLLSTQYSDSEGAYIFLNQVASRSWSEFVDNEHGDFTERELNGKKVMIHNEEGAMHAAWIENGYYFSLTICDTIDIGEFEELIMSVKIK